MRELVVDARITGAKRDLYPVHTNILNMVKSGLTKQVVCVAWRLLAALALLIAALPLSKRLQIAKANRKALRVTFNTQ